MVATYMKKITQNTHCVTGVYLREMINLLYSFLFFLGGGHLNVSHPSLIVIFCCCCCCFFLHVNWQYTSNVYLVSFEQSLECVHNEFDYFQEQTSWSRDWRLWRSWAPCCRLSPSTSLWWVVPPWCQVPLAGWLYCLMVWISTWIWPSNQLMAVFGTLTCVTLDSLCPSSSRLLRWEMCLNFIMFIWKYSILFHLSVELQLYYF